LAIITKGVAIVGIIFSLLLSKYLMTFNNILLLVSYTLAVIGHDLDLLVDSQLFFDISESVKFAQIASLILVGSFCTLSH
jgi:hypothetical protein